MKTKEAKFNPMKILSSEEKKEIEKELQKSFGIRKIPGMLIMKGQERVFLFTGDFDEKKIKKLESQIIVERVGIYFGKISEERVRLSLEGTNFLKEQITKNIFDLTKDQAEKWLMGNDLDVRTGKKGFLIMRQGKDFLGCGKASEMKIGNFIPKARRLKNKSQ